MVLGKLSEWYCRNHPDGFLKPFSMYRWNILDGIGGTIQYVFRGGGEGSKAGVEAQEAGYFNT
jgi:hypothetical protein